MKIRDWINNSFTVNSKIKWPCPNCNKPTLKIDKEKFHYDETAGSKMNHQNEFWEFELATLIFSGKLICEKCGETVTITGYGSIESIQYYDQTTNDLQGEIFEEFEPIFFHPPLNIFKIPENCPKKVKNEIIDSFKLFWFDLPSCANTLRTSLEHLLNEEKVKKAAMRKKGGLRRLKLHERILEYKNKNNEVAEFLEAIKWIGNTGSHIGALERTDLLDAYELLEFSLNKLFNNKEIELQKITKEINKRKGTRKK